MYKGFAEVDTIPNTHKRLREEIPCIGLHAARLGSQRCAESRIFGQ